MGAPDSRLDREKLRVQKDVVKNEYRQNYANRPYGMVWRILAEALYPPTIPIAGSTIGVMEEVEAATREDVEALLPPLLRPEQRQPLPGRRPRTRTERWRSGRALLRRRSPAGRRR